MYDFESSSTDQEHEGYGQELLDNVESRKTSANEAININNLQKKLRGQVSKNDEDVNINGEKYALFAKAEQNDWESAIDKAKNVNELRDIQRKIANESGKIKDLAKNYVSTMEQNSDAFTKDSKRGLDTKQQYLADFMKLDAKGKAKRMAELQNDIEDRYKVIEDILKIDPSMEPHLKTMRRSEREKKLEELQKLKDGVEKGLKPHKEFIADFTAFPSEFKSMSDTDFTRLTLKEKQKEIDKMTQKMETNYYKMLENCKKQRAFSPEEIGLSRANIQNKSIPLRDNKAKGVYGKISAYILLEKQAKRSLEKVKNFREKINQFPSNESMAKEKRTALEDKFYNGGDEKKEEILKVVEQEIEELKDKYLDAYLIKLQTYQGNNGKGIISVKTATDFAKWLALQPLKDQPTLSSDGALTNEIEKQGYKETFDNFNKAISLLSSVKKAHYEEQFFDPNIGGTRRKEILADILKNEQINKTTLDELPETEADVSPGKNNISTAQQRENPTSVETDLEHASDEELERIAKNGMDATSILEKRKQQTALNELAGAAKASELANNNQKNAERRTQGLTDDQQELQEQMAQDSKDKGKKMVLGQNRATGQIEAQEVITVNVDKVDEQTPEQRRKLEIAGTKIQRTPSEGLIKAGAGIEFKNDAGETVTADTGLKRTQEKEDKLADVFAIKMAKDQRERGRNISKGAEKRLAKAAKKNMNVRLEAQEDRVGA